MMSMNYTNSYEKKRKKLYQNSGKKKQIVYPIQDHMLPPKDAELVFMGCGKRSSSKIKLGIIATPDDIFTGVSYKRDEYDKARPVKNYFTYYDNDRNNVIGFSLDELGVKINFILYSKIYLVKLLKCFEIFFIIIHYENFWI